MCFHGCGAEVFRASPAGTVVGPTGAGHVDLTQSVRAWPNVRYRLDVHVEAARSLRDGGSAGLVQVRFASSRAGQEIRTYEPPAMHVDGDVPAIHRAVFQCPPGTGRLQVRLRFRVEHPVVVKRVRLVETGDYLLTSHALANLPLPSREPPPHVPDSAMLCDGRRDDRPLLRWLQGVFGKKYVRRVGLQELIRGEQRTRQALVLDLPEDRGPGLEQMLAWSDKAIVIVSLATFAGAADRARIRSIRIQDRISGLDMPCGEVVLAGCFTRGFALADAIPYAWNDGHDDFAHRYLAMPKPTKAQLAEMGIQPTIVTECGQRECGNHPLVLQRAGKHGALLVMDPDGLERGSAGEDVPRIFDLLWRNSLGRETVTLGQFSAPPTHYEGMLVDLVEVAKHYDLVENLSVLTRIRGKGDWPPTWLLPAKRHDRFTDRPTLLIRTGFAEGDWPAVYGLILWLKRLALAVTRSDPVGRELLERMRVLAWPISQPQEWRGCPKDVTAPRSGLADKSLLGQIDLQVGQERRTVVLVPDAGSAATVRRALGKGGADIRVAAGAFEGDAPTGRGSHLRCKVLLPSIPQPFPANSPFLTDQAATILQGLALAVAGQVPRARKTSPPGRG